MGNLKKLFDLPPLTKEDMHDDLAPLAIPSDELQLQADTANVLEGRVAIETFPSDYQTKIKDYYRFYGTRMYSQNPVYFKRTLDTLDLV